MAYISLLILAFTNGCISAKTSLINTKLGDFVNLDVLSLTTWIIANPIIYRLVLSPPRFENRQLKRVECHILGIGLELAWNGGSRGGKRFYVICI